MQVPVGLRKAYRGLQDEAKLKKNPLFAIPSLSLRACSETRGNPQMPLQVIFAKYPFRLSTVLGRNCKPGY